MRGHRPAGRGRFAAVLLAAALVLGLTAPVAGAAQSKRPLPRFVAVKAGEVNVRSGPGERYPIQWVLKRKHLPLQVIQEFDTWRKVRDWEGAVGWVHASTLTGRRSVIVTGQVRTLRRRPARDAPAVAHAEPTVVGRLIACRPGWCRVQVRGYRGWLKRGEFWGVRKGEMVK